MRLHTLLLALGAAQPIAAATHAGRHGLLRRGVIDELDMDGKATDLPSSLRHMFDTGAPGLVQVPEAQPGDQLPAAAAATHGRDVVKEAKLANAYQHASDSMAAARSVVIDEATSGGSVAETAPPTDAAASGMHGFRNMFQLGDGRGTPIGSITAVEEGIQPTSISDADLETGGDSTEDETGTPRPSAWELRANAEQHLHGQPADVGISGVKGSPGNSHPVQAGLPQDSRPLPSSKPSVKHRQRQPIAPDTSLLDGASPSVPDVDEPAAKTVNVEADKGTHSDEAGDKIYAKVLRKFALSKQADQGTPATSPVDHKEEDDDDDDASLQMPKAKDSQMTAPDGEQQQDGAADAVGLAEQIAMASIHSAKSTESRARQPTAAQKRQLLDEDGTGGVPVGGYRNLFSGRAPAKKAPPVGLTQSEMQADAGEKADTSIEERAAADANDQTGSDATAAGLAHHFSHLFSNDANSSSSNHTGNSSSAHMVDPSLTARSGQEGGVEDEQDGLRDLRIISGQDPDSGKPTAAMPVAALDVGEDADDASDQEAADAGEEKKAQFDAPGHFKALFGSIH